MRCTSANVLMESCWFEGPKFLSDVTATLDNNEKSMLCEDDPEVRLQVAMHITSMIKDTTLKSDRFMRFSKWSALRRTLANLIVNVRELKNRRKTLAKENVEGPHPPCQPLNLQQPIQLPRLPSSAELKQTETVLIKTVQSENFATEIATLHSTDLDPEKTKNDLKKSNLYRLNPFLDDCGVLRVGGRLRRSNQDFVEKHPAILPKGHHLSHLVITHHHEKVYHQVRQITSEAIHQAGFGSSELVVWYRNQYE